MVLIKDKGIAGGITGAFVGAAALCVGSSLESWTIFIQQMIKSYQTCEKELGKVAVNIAQDTAHKNVSENLL
jgi:hypothetical protein